MAKIKHFTEMSVYSEAIVLTQNIFNLTHNEVFKREFSLVDQMKRAALSIPANIAEGYGRRSKKDFAHFLSISLGSINELECYLYFVNKQFGIEVKSFQQQVNSAAKQIYNFRAYLLESHF